MTPTKSREDFIADFKKQNETKYVNTFKTEPTVRPSYIPTTTTVAGVTTPIAYNSLLGRYGYYSGGTFIAYDPLEIAAITTWTSALNSRPSIYTQTNSYSGVSFALIVFLVIIVVGLILLFGRSTRL